MSMKSYKARGIVLHTLKYGDSGMVVYLLTDSGGRQSYMVQGVRSARGHGSKLALFQPMFAVEFEGLESSRMQMHRFREVRSGIVLQSLPFDVRKSTIALFMAEVLYRLVKEYEPNQRLFDFVWGSVASSTVCVLLPATANTASESDGLPAISLASLPNCCAVGSA